MTKTLIYWISRLDSIHTCIDWMMGASLLIIIVSTIAYIIARIVICCTDYHNSNTYINPDWKAAKNIVSYVKPWLILATSLFFFMMGIRTFIPTTKELAAIYVIPEIATEQNVEKLKSINANILDAVSTWIKNQTILDTIEVGNQHK